MHLRRFDSCAADWSAAAASFMDCSLLFGSLPGLGLGRVLRGGRRPDGRIDARRRRDQGREAGHEAEGRHHGQGRRVGRRGAPWPRAALSAPVLPSSPWPSRRAWSWAWSCVGVRGGGRARASTGNGCSMGSVNTCLALAGRPARGRKKASNGRRTSWRCARRRRRGARGFWAAPI